MKIIYLDCSMGVSGDMLLSSLSGLLPDIKEFEKVLNGIGIPGLNFELVKSSRGGISGLYSKVQIFDEVEGIHGEHHAHEEHVHNHIHRSINDIKGIVDNLRLDKSIKETVNSVYKSISEAEGKVHGEEPELVHFHELGALDAVCDIVGVCILIDMIKPDRIICSSINLGSGTVKTEHGILPVPAPATAELLKGIPCYESDIKGELCTPTGAALVKYIVAEYGKMPNIKIENIGYGLGTKEFERPNCLRAVIGDINDSDLNLNNEIVELSCNIDDMTGEDIAYLTNVLLDEGALDSYIVTAQTKKSRPLYILVCITEESREKELARIIFEHSTTFGLRRKVIQRYRLNREIKTIETKYGTVRVKEGQGWGITKTKVEYEDLARIAKKYGLTIAEVRKSINA